MIFINLLYFFFILKMQLNFSFYNQFPNIYIFWYFLYYFLDKKNSVNIFQSSKRYEICKFINIYIFFIYIFWCLFYINHFFLLTCTTTVVLYKRRAIMLTLEWPRRIMRKKIGFIMIIYKDSQGSNFDYLGRSSVNVMI